MPATTTRLRRSGKYRFRSTVGPAITRPANLKELMEILNPLSQFTGPFRPMGANSASTDCNASSAGTVIDMTGMDNILNIDSYKYTVTVQAGLRIGVLASALEQHGLELVGSHDLMERTVGGAIAGGCIGPTIADDGAFFASQVIAMRVLTPGGKLSKVVNDGRKLLYAFRLSYGMLGVICEATLKVRPVRGFVATHRRCNIKQFAAATESLSKTSIGVKFYLMPFQDRVYLDLRRYSPEARASRKIPWKLKDWGESTVLPHIFKSITRIVPISGVRYRIIDEISKATQGIVNNRLVSSGSNSTTLSRKPGRDRSKPLQYSTWLFPAADFSIVVLSYSDFCKRIQKESGFRCDMPTVGFRLSKDQSALLSPSFDEPMFALRAVSTQTRGWEDFTIDFAEFAEHWGGYAFFNQTRSLSVDHAASAFGKRLASFRNIRRQLDPDDRMMNPFLSQYFL
jgi:FAD binding domain-containing protein